MSQSVPISPHPDSFRPRRPRCYERRFRPDATLDDLDLPLAESSLRDTPFRGRPVLEALDRYGLVQRDACDWRVTNAALLLFARRPALRWHPRAGLRVFREGPQPSMTDDLRNRGVIRRLDGTLRPTLYGIMAFGKHPQEYPHTGNFVVRCGAYIGDDQGTDVISVSEALANAVVHRDYSITGSPVVLDIVRSRVMVTSPGALPNHMTVESVRAGGRPRSRNELMVNALVAARMMETRGRGWLLMKRAMANHGLPEPEIVNDPVGRVVRVTLWRNAP